MVLEGAMEKNHYEHHLATNHEMFKNSMLQDRWYNGGSNMGVTNYFSVDYRPTP